MNLYFAVQNLERDQNEISDLAVMITSNEWTLRMQMTRK